MKLQLNRRALVLGGTAAATSAMVAGQARHASPAAAYTALNRQDRTYLWRGLNHGAWVSPEDGTAFGTNPQLYREGGFTTPTFYKSPLCDGQLLSDLGRPFWGMAQGPVGGMLQAPPPASSPLFSSEAMANIDKLWIACMGDENPYSATVVQWFKTYFDRVHRELPNRLVHNNQAPNQWTDAQMRTYIRIAKPDLLTFDNYYFHRAVQYPGGSVSPLYRETARYRRLALEGTDGAGNDVMTFGQYTTGWLLKPDDPQDPNQAQLYVSESQQMAVGHVTWALGGKWLTMFRWNYSPTRPTFFSDATGALTPHYARYQRFNQIRAAYSPYLTRVRTNKVAIRRGIDGTTGVVNPAPSADLPDLTRATDPWTAIVDISATNLGTANNGARGDVVLGTFRPTPGITAAERSTWVPGPSLAMFMVVNGLVWRNADWKDAHGTGGDGDDTKQSITIHFDIKALANRQLYRVDPATGVAARITLRPGAAGQLMATFAVRGGEGELLYLY